MQGALRITTIVKSDHRIEITDPALPPGNPVDVIVLLPTPIPGRHSVIDVLDAAPGGLAFKSADEVDAYLSEERDSWES